MSDRTRLYFWGIRAESLLFIGGLDVQSTAHEVPGLKPVRELVRRSLNFYNAASESETMYVYMYVCACVYVYVCMYVCMCMYVCLYVCLYVC